MNATGDKKTEENDIEETEVLDNKIASRCCASVSINNFNGSKSVDNASSSKIVNKNSQHIDYSDKCFIDKTTASIANISSSVNGINSHFKECSNFSINDTDTGSSNGARPKIKTVCNNSSGVIEHSGIQKVNNNFVTTKFQKLQNGNQEINGMDIYLRNTDNISKTVECPPKVPNNTSNRNNCKDEWHSSSENEGEDEEECCFYTYKGDCNPVADLPSSFFKLDTSVPRCNAGSRSSSPDMDYLEMDFDPGPLNDRDSPSISDSDCFDICTQSRPTTPLPVAENCELQGVIEIEDDINNLHLDTTSPLSKPTSPQPEVTVCLSLPTQNLVSEPNSSTSAVDIADRCGSSEHSSESRHSHSCGLSEELNSHSAISLTVPVSSTETDYYKATRSNVLSPFQITLDKTITIAKEETSHVHENDIFLQSEDAAYSQLPVEKVMIWNETEASIKQVNQIATSACGVTAVINVLIALNLSFSLERLKEAVGVRLRRDTAPLPDYLFSRCDAGATHYDMIRGIETISQRSLFARFFPMYPTRSFSLCRWLSYWMKRGAVPIATMNLQQGDHPVSLIPDWWHHQMIFGIGPKGIYLTNPLECINEVNLMTMLTSPPVLKVRRKDIIDRWTPDTDLMPLMVHPNPAWKRLNVLGQVVNMIRESQRPSSPNCPGSTSHLTIPASYSSGITLVIPRENPGFYDLTLAPDLPLLSINDCSSL